MATLENYKADKPIKMLVIGDTGTGKTGALASLANAGYKLHILDYDNGLDILSTTVQGDKFQNVEYETLTEKKKAVGGQVLIQGAPKSFAKGLALLTEWGQKYTSKEDVIVIDSLTFFSDAAMEHVLAGAGHTGRQPEIQEWGLAMSLMEDVLSILYSDDIKCNVIVNAHIKYIQDEGTGVIKALVNTLGSKLPPKVGRYFNHLIMAQQQATGKRVLLTKGAAMFGLKSPNPNIKAQYPIESGLADYFKDVKGA